MPCPFCKDRSNCEHLFLTYDATFGEVVDGEGYAEVRALDDALAGYIDHQAILRSPLRDDMEVAGLDEINDLIKSMRAELKRTYTAAELKELEPDDHDGVTAMFTQEYADTLFGNIIGNHMDVYESSEDDEGGPGMSSTYKKFYCKDPEPLRQEIKQWTHYLRAGAE